MRMMFSEFVNKFNKIINKEGRRKFDENNYSITKDFISNKESSILIFKDGGLDTILTELNRIKPIDRNRPLYFNHLVCQVHQDDLDLLSLEKIIEDNLHMNTESVFIKDVDLNGSSDRLLNKKTIKLIKDNLQFISDSLGVDVTILTTMNECIKVKTEYERFDMWDVSRIKNREREVITSAE